jgi:class 3 adenylate cyclase/Tfp pilus assembly protein PilF
MRYSLLLLLFCHVVHNYGQHGPERRDQLVCEWDRLVVGALKEKDAGDQKNALLLLDSAWRIAEVPQEKDLFIRTDGQRGLTYLEIGKYEKAWLHWSRALEQAEKAQDMDAIADLQNYLGVARYHLKDNKASLEHFQKSLELRRRIGRPYDLGVMLNNIASYEMDFGSPRKALRFFRESLDHWDNIGVPSWRSTTFRHIGTCYEKINMPDSARWYYEQAYHFVLNDANVGKRIARLDQSLGEWHLKYGDPRKAIELCANSLRQADARKLHDHIVQNCLCLSGAFEKVGDFGNALKFHKRAIAVKDSASIEDQQREVAFLQAELEYDKKMLTDSLKREEERLKAQLQYTNTLSHERNNRNLFLFSTFGVLLLAGGLYNRLRFIRRSRELVRAERDRADKLLHNILPVAVADELLLKGHVDAREFARATVLFTDFQGFTGIAEQLSAKELVATIDTYFKDFDRILNKHGVEKIKTVGDCYMVCGGVPDTTRGAPADVVKAGLELQAYMRTHEQQRREKGLPYFKMRVGIHTGPVVAGIVGSDKFAFDIWGDTVNIAARMENTGEIGRVNISASTYELIKNDPSFHFVPRGMIQTKGKGKLQMYFVELEQVQPIHVEQFQSS